MKFKKVCPKCKSKNIIGISGRTSKLFSNKNLVNLLQIDALHSVEVVIVDIVKN